MRVPDMTVNLMYKNYLPRMIHREACQDRHLYRLRSRNLLMGVWDAPTQGFLGLRTKWGRVFVFKEYHYENEHYATAVPYEDLGEVLPADIHNVDCEVDFEHNLPLDAWLHEMEAKYWTAPEVYVV